MAGVNAVTWQPGEHTVWVSHLDKLYWQMFKLQRRAARSQGKHVRAAGMLSSKRSSAFAEATRAGSS
jgi:hypothetical protein